MKILRTLAAVAIMLNSSRGLMLVTRRPITWAANTRSAATSARRIASPAIATTSYRVSQRPHRTFHHALHLSSSSSSNPEITSEPPFYTPRDKNDKTCWRPTVSDVERISWGLPAKKKGTGSRGIPHRLSNHAEERILFDLARRDGFLQVTGTAWRSQRRDAPLLNTYRSLCDARAQVSIVLHKGTSTTTAAAVGSTNGMILDQVVLDLSPLRLSKVSLEYVATKVLEEGYDGHKGAGRILGAEVDETDNHSLEAAGEIIENNLLQVDGGTQKDDATSDAVKTRPIYQLSPYCVLWELPRHDAKALGKKLAAVFGTSEGKSGTDVGASKKPLGVKPGKSRRSGGYGIG